MQGPLHAGLQAGHAGPAVGAAATRVESGAGPGNPHGAQGPSTTHQGRKAPPRRRVLTSLSLQVFLYFGGWWDLFYYVLNILVFIYKGVNLPYPERNFAMEFCFAWLWVFIEIPRLFLASKGNKTECVGPLIFSFILAAPLIAMYVYFVKYQTYVLKIDEILSAIALAFISLQVVLGLLASFRFLVATRFT